MIETYDAVVVGGGPCGATAASELARQGRSVLLLDRDGRIKPCGGAIPPRLIRDFGIPDHLLTARVTSARMIAPSSRAVDMPIDNGFVGMVDRDVFDEWLRERAAANGAERRTGTFKEITWDPDGVAVVHFRQKGDDKLVPAERVRARVVVGADGAKSSVAAQCIKGAEQGAACLCLSRDRSLTGRRVSTANAATFITRAGCRRISTAGCFRMAIRPASAADPCTRDFRCGSRSARCGKPPGLPMPRPSGGRARPFRCARCGAGTMDGT